MPHALPPNDASIQKEVVDQLRQRMEHSKNPIIIVDGFAVRNNLQDLCEELSELTSFPTFTTCMGKGGIDETMPNFCGLYSGAGTYDGVKKAVESSDAVFRLGNVQVSIMSVIAQVDLF